MNPRTQPPLRYPDGVRTDDFAYDLPAELIAQTPIEPRDAARLLVLHCATGSIDHRTFADLPQFLRPGDALVVNETRVLAARLHGVLASGGRVEALLTRQLDAERWQALVRPSRKLQRGRSIQFGEATATVEEVLDGGARVLRFPVGCDPTTVGETPLPPYIRTPASDPERYQTVYGRVLGSAAAPTAGLHLTPQLLAQLEAGGVTLVRVLLHIGTGTFRPVTVEDPREHPMHSEAYALDEAAANALNETRQAGGRIVAVGTTAVRVLEHVAQRDSSGIIRASTGETRLLILPGHHFRAVDALVTNFHLPRSTLLMLVSAFAGREAVLGAYRTAVRERYRFFSFGDAMLLV